MESAGLDRRGTNGRGAPDDGARSPAPSRAAYPSGRQAVANERARIQTLRAAGADLTAAEQFLAALEISLEAKKGRPKSDARTKGLGSRIIQFGFSVAGRSRPRGHLGNAPAAQHCSRW